jgi:hypothetical protein
MTYPPNAPVPPPMPPPAPPEKPHPIGWAAVVAGICGLLALFLPWFTPTATANGQTATASTSFHAWNGVFLLIVGPIALIVLGVLWSQAMTGRVSTRFAASANPIRTLSLQSVIAGAVAVVVGILAFPIFGATYRITGLTGNRSVKWTDAVTIANRAGIKLSKGTQIGLWILFVGGALMILVGVVGLLTKRSTSEFPAADYGPPAEYLPPQGPPSGYAPPTPQEYPQPQAYPQPQPGYSPPPYEPPPTRDPPSYPPQ